MQRGETESLFLLIFAAGSAGLLSACTGSQVDTIPVEVHGQIKDVTTGAGVPSQVIQLREFTPSGSAFRMATFRPVVEFVSHTDGTIRGRIWVARDLELIASDLDCKRTDAEGSTIFKRSDYERSNRIDFTVHVRDCP